MATVERAPDTELLLRLRARDRAAWEELYAEFQPRLRAFAYRLSGNVHDADDLVQETFVRAVPRLDRLDPADVDLGAYLFTTCKHLFYKQVEKSRRAEPVADVPEPIAPTAIDDDPERAALLRSQQHDVRVANSHLDSRQRLVLALRELEDRSYAEIGEIVGLKENAVAQLIFRARESLRVEVRLAQVDPEQFPEACRRFLPLLAKHLDGELKGPRLDETLAHLEGCERCQSALADMREASRRYRALLLPPLFDADECKAAIDLHLEQTGFWANAGKARPFGGRRLRLAAAGGAVAALAIGGAVLGVALADDGSSIGTEPVALGPSIPAASTPTPSVPETIQTGGSGESTAPGATSTSGEKTTATSTEQEPTVTTPTAPPTTAPKPEPEPKPKPTKPKPTKPKPKPTPPPPTAPPPTQPTPPADTRAPTITITQAPTGTTSSTSASIAFSADEKGVSFNCSTDGSEPAPCTSPVTLQGLGAGEHRFSVLGTDKAGNASGWVVVSWKVVPADTTAPTTRITVAPPTTTTSTLASIEFTADETPVTFECALDGGAYAACTSPVRYSRLGVGQHTAAVRAKDAAGNVGKAASVSWSVVAPLPDLVVSAFSAFSITVTNRGTATAQASILTITLVGTFTVPSLAPGASVTLRWSTCKPGTYTAVVDRTNVVTESDEKNNTASRTNTCQIP